MVLSLHVVVRHSALSGLICLLFLSLTTPEAMAGTPKFRFGGFAAFDYFQYVESVEGAAPAGKEAAHAVASLRIAPKMKAKFRFLRATVDTEFRHDFVDPGRGPRFIVREASLGFRRGGFRVEGGAILPRWGKMDTASPTDNLVAWDLEELFEHEALPVPGFRFAYARDVVAAEVVFLPAFRASRFRRSSPSRWDTRWTLPQTQTVPLGISELEFANDYVSFLDPVVVGDEPELAAPLELGARVDLYLRGVDLGFSFAAVHDRLPSYTGFRVTNVGDSDGDGLPDHVQSSTGEVEVTPHHSRLLIPGMDLAVSAGPVMLKGEAAYFHTTDPDATNCLIDDPYVRFAGGAELMLNNLKGDFDLALRLQYSGDLPVSSAEAQADQEAACPGGQLVEASDPEVGLIATDYEQGFQATPHIRHIAKHAFYWNVNMAFTPQLALDIRGFADLSGDALLKLEFSALIAEQLRLRVGGLAMLSVGEDTIFTPYAHNHRLELGLKYLF